MYKHVLFAFSFLFFWVSCHYYPADNQEELLARGKALVNTRPDSTLVLLGSISFPEDLKEGSFHQYILLETQAKDKTYNDIRDDSLIFEAKKYFAKKKDWENLALAAFYCGRVLYENGKLEEALPEYLEAGAASEHADDNALKGLIHIHTGYIYYNQLLLDPAKAHYQEADKLLDIDKDTKNKALANSYTGNVFLLEGTTDSAMYYYNKGLDMARKYSLTDVLSDIKQNMGLACLNRKEYRQAKQYYREALNICGDSLSHARILYNTGYAEALQNHNDSATLYMNKAVRFMPDTAMYLLQANMHKGLSAVYENKKDYVNTIKHIKRYAALIQDAFKENQSKAIYSIGKKYNNELLKNRQHRLRIQQQYTVIVALGIILILTVITSVLAYQRKKEKHRRLEMEKSNLHLQAMANSFNEKENTFRNRLLKQFDILKKSAVLKTMLNDEEFKKGKTFFSRFNEIVYGKKSIDWDMLYDIMNELHEKFFENLHKNHPSLSESEFRICSLIYTDFSNDEIGVIMNLAASSITKKRSSIRKKLGINDYASIRDYLKKEE